MLGAATIRLGEITESPVAAVQRTVTGG